MIDLDDAEAVSRAAGDELLAIASAGATVRRAASGIRPTGVELTAEHVGAVAVVVSELLLPAYGDALAELSMRLGGPIATQLLELTPSAPFPRAADVVVIVSVSGLERRLLDSLQVAAARGATTIVAAPEGSPVATAAIERHLDVVAYDVSSDDAVTAWWAALAAVVAAWRGSSALDELADDLDATAAALGPVAPTYDNPAKQIATTSGPLLIVALDDLAATPAALLSEELGARSSYSVRSIDLRRGPAQLQQYAASARSGSSDDLFYDPLIDGPDQHAPTRQILLLTGAAGQQTVADALQMAERVGVVRLVPFDAQQRWGVITQILLAQLSGSYYALANN